VVLLAELGGNRIKIMLQEWGIFLCHLLNFIDVDKNENFDGF
jgi:hypothetical protein